MIETIKNSLGEAIDFSLKKALITRNGVIG